MSVPQKVNFADDPRDRMALRLAALGRPAAYIAYVCRMTESQVRYRVNNRARMRLKEIRSGTDKFHFLSIVERDKSIMEKVDNAVNKMLETERVCINGQMQPVNHNHRSPQ